MSIGSALILVGIFSTAPQGVYVEDAYSQIEARLDKAQEKLVQARTYTCRDENAKTAIQLVQLRLQAVKASARRVLGRELNLQIWTNSCRRTGDGPRFRNLLSSADRDIAKASRLIAEETR